ncbi:MAG: cytochrome c [Pseudolabrys sp.]
MLRKLILLAIAAAFVGAVVFWFVTIPATVPASALGSHTPNLDNGKEMFNAGGCASCHAVPDQNDRTNLAGGLGLHSPFGTFYVPNISSDKKDGIGDWTEAQFVTAMMKGTSPDGRHYFPAFPYSSYQRMTVNDLRDLFAYLKTLPAKAGVVRDHDVPFPFNVRRSLGGWKFLFLDGKPFEPDPKQSAEWNRGAYLVNGPGHCAECHSPRNILGGIESGKRFSGGPNPEGKGFIPNITQARLKNWSVGDIESLLDSGLTPEGDSVGGSMTAVIRNTAQLTKADRRAMAVYLKSLAPIEGMRPKSSGK